MVHIYEKIPKSEENNLGIREITSENPLKDGPCIITVLALPQFIKNINGSLRQVADLVNPNIDNNYDPDRRLLGLGFGDVNEYGKFSKFGFDDEDLTKFLETYLYPLFMGENGKLDVLEVMKNFRNVNFLTYCNGAKEVNKIEYKLTEKLKSMGYSYKEVNMILSQMCWAVVGGDIFKFKNTNMLAVAFGDVNDTDYEREDQIVDYINQNGDGFISYDSALGFAVSDDGDHSFKKLMTGNPELSKMISAFLNTSLDNAIENRNNEVIDPITYEKMARAFENSKSR